jgi:hypothetical protein
MSDATFMAGATAFVGLLIWLPIRTFNRLESWDAAVAVFVMTAGTGGTIVLHLARVLGL